MLGCKERALDALWFYEPSSWTGGTGCCWPSAAQCARPLASASKCRVSRSERHFSTVNISPLNYRQCIPSCRQMCLGKKEFFWFMLLSSLFQLDSYRLQAQWWRAMSSAWTRHLRLAVLIMDLSSSSCISVIFYKTIQAKIYSFKGFTMATGQFKCNWFKPLALEQPADL